MTHGGVLTGCVPVTLVKSLSLNQMNDPPVIGPLIEFRRSSWSGKVKAVINISSPMLVFCFIEVMAVSIVKFRGTQSMSLDCMKES